MKISLSPNEFWELLLSHHPNDECFKDETVILFGKRICAGCVLAYPVALIVFFVFNPTGWQSIFVAILLSLASQARRLIHRTPIKLLFRGIAGIGLGFGLGGLLWAISVQEWIAVLLLIIGGIIYGLVRVYFLKKKIEEYVEGKKE